MATSGDDVLVRETWTPIILNSNRRDAVKRFLAYVANNQVQIFDTEEEAIEWGKKHISNGQRGNVAVYEIIKMVKHQTPPVVVEDVIHAGFTPDQENALKELSKMNLAPVYPSEQQKYGEDYDRHRAFVNAK